MPSVSKVVGTGVNVDNGGDNAWTNASAITADDGSYATSANVGANETTQLLVGTMQGNEFTVPAGSRIDGVEVLVDTNGSAGSSMSYTLTDVRLRYAGNSVGMQRAGFEFWGIGNGVQVHTFGSATVAEFWGPCLNVAMVNDSSFGFSLAAVRDGSSVQSAEVDHITITVHYTEGAGDIVYNGVADVGVCAATMTFRVPEGDTTTFVFPGLGQVRGALFFGVPSSSFFTDTDSPNGAETRTQHDFAMRSSVGVATSDVNQMNSGTISRQGDYIVRRNVWSNAVVQPSGNPANNFYWLGVVPVSGLGIDTVTLATSFFQTAALDHGYPVVCVAFGGSDTQYHYKDQDELNGLTNETDIVNTGFETALAILVSGMEIPLATQQSHGAYGGQSFGLATWDGAQLTQVNCHSSQQFSTGTGPLSNVATNGRVSTDRIHLNLDFGENSLSPGARYWWDVSNFTSTGYTVTGNGDNPGAGTNPPNDGGTFLSIGGLANAAIGTFTTPTSTGAVTWDDTNFAPTIGGTPRFMLQMWSKLLTLEDEQLDSAQGEVLGFSVMLGHCCFSWCCTTPVGSGNSGTDTGPETHNSWKMGGTFIQDSDDTIFHEDAFGGFVFGGYQSNISVADASARKGIYLAVHDGGAVQPSVGNPIRMIV